MRRLGGAWSAFWSHLRGRSDYEAQLAEQRYNVLESIPDGFFIVDNAWRFTHVNEQAELMLRKDATQLIGQQLDGILDPLASELLPEMKLVRQSGLPVDRLQYFRSSHSWVEIRIQPAANELLVYLRDVTQRKKAELLLRESERRLRLLLHQVPAILWTVDLDLHFTSVVGTGLASQDLEEERLMGGPFARILDHADTTKDKISAIRRVFDGESQRFEARRGERWLQHHVEPLRDASGDILGAIGVALDITEIKEGADHLARLARQDAMTGLPNRLALEETLLPMLADAEKRRESVAVLFIDLDRFKTINDTLGHRIGDELLRSVATR
ncbi:MAG TPA: PAS domain-containing protein, partial [Gemmatimonadaceae bacterium]